MVSGYLLLFLLFSWWVSLLLHHFHSCWHTQHQCYFVLLQLGWWCCWSCCLRRWYWQSTRSGSATAAIWWWVKETPDWYTYRPETLTDLCIQSCWGSLDSLQKTEAAHSMKHTASWLQHLQDMTIMFLSTYKSQWHWHSQTKSCSGVLLCRCTVRYVLLSHSGTQVWHFHCCSAGQFHFHCAGLWRMGLESK